MSRHDATKTVLETEIAKMEYVLADEDKRKAIEAQFEALSRVSADGKTVITTDKGARLNAHKNAESLFDDQFPKGSLERAFFEANQKNAQIQIQSGNSSGVRHSALVLSTVTQLLPRIGKTAYSQLAKVLPCLPSYSTVSRLKNFIPSNERGPLVSMITAVRLQIEAKNGGKPTDIAVALCNDEAVISPSLTRGVKAGELDGFTTRASGGITTSELRKYLDYKVKSVADDTTAALLTYESMEAKLADRYHVFYASVLNSREPLTFMAARYFTKDTSAADLAVMQLNVMGTLEVNGMRVVALVQDGASTNRSFYLSFGLIKASEFFTAVEMAKYPNIDFSFKIAMRHPFFGKSRPVFLLDDSPHWLKKMRNLLYNSNHTHFSKEGFPIVTAKSRVTEPRHLKIPKLDTAGDADAGFLYRFYPLNLNMIQRGVGLYPNVSPSTSAASLQAVRGVTRANFVFKNAADKMKVSRARAVFSREVAQVIQENSALINFVSMGLPDYDSYAGLMEYCKRVDEMYAFFNSERGRRHFDFHTITDLHSPELPRLLDHLQWFSKWKEDLKGLGLTDEQERASFLTPETWAETQSLCLGFNCLARQYLGQGKLLSCIIGRRFTQDPAESHFSHVRYHTKGQGTTVASISVAGSAGCSVVLAKSGVLKSEKQNAMVQRGPDHSSAAHCKDYEVVPWTQERLQRASSQDKAQLKGYVEGLRKRKRQTPMETETTSMTVEAMDVDETTTIVSVKEV